ncbi:general odorant-binding protein 67-like [Anopheles albimanus]|uniref:OBP47-like domain-containing protein n=1 Tax=Anopheles albimanus TaxID=7167 RepID=A0A182FG64_ANOAL|nr:general odorant-binding protein 67-like [Anopheles albimanus]
MNSFNGNSIVAVAVLLFASVVTAAPNSCAKLDIQTDPFSCCTIPKLLDLAVVGKCFEQYPIDQPDGKGNKPASSSPQTDCMSECILNATAIYNKKGDLNDKKLNNVFLDSLPKNSPWLSVVRDAVKQCGETAAKKENDFKKEMAQQKKAAGAKATGPVCNPEASFLVDCIHTTVFSNCPTTLRSTSADCDAIWKFLKNCPFSALRQ